MELYGGSKSDDTYLHSEFHQFFLTRSQTLTEVQPQTTTESPLCFTDGSREVHVVPLYCSPLYLLRIIVY